MEAALNGGNADWEITRYAGVEHGFTSWESQAYSLKADYRSWESMLTSLRELMPVPELVATAVDDGDVVTSSNKRNSVSLAVCVLFLATIACVF